LRRLFTELGFANVATLIASGNVIFQTDAAGDGRDLEWRIERHLQQALGYDVATFLRTPQEVTAVAAYDPFAGLCGEQPHSFFVAFLAQPPTDEAKARLLALGNAIDTFHLYGREVYWLRHDHAGPSKFTGGALEKALRLPATVRNITTVRKLAATYPPAGMD